MVDPIVTRRIRRREECWRCWIRDVRERRVHKWRMKECRRSHDRTAHGWGRQERESNIERLSIPDRKCPGSQNRRWEPRRRHGNRSGRPRA